MSKKILIGRIVSSKTPKTLVVDVSRFKTHPIYKKKYRVNKRFLVHCEKSDYKVGDTIKIIECRPRSKRKRFEVL